jgi:hypothetical protein
MLNLLVRKCLAINATAWLHVSPGTPGCETVTMADTTIHHHS